MRVRVVSSPVLGTRSTRTFPTPPRPSCGHSEAEAHAARARADGRDCLEDDARPLGPDLTCCGPLAGARHFSAPELRPPRDRAVEVEVAPPALPPQKSVWVARRSGWPSRLGREGGGAPFAFRGPSQLAPWSMGSLRQPLQSPGYGRGGAWWEAARRRSMAMPPVDDLLTIAA
jgi:hypothetical protein